jgi:hypothetical protein
MKKLLVVALLATLAVSAFGVDFALSAGAGATVGGFSQTTYFEPYIIIPGFWEYDSRKEIVATTPFGVTAFFDATYALVEFGFRANGDPHRTITTIDGATVNTTETDIDQRSGFLTFTLLGRFPFTLGPISLFPLLGIEYDLNLYLKAADGTDLKAALPEEERPWLNQFWFKGGAGADIIVYKGLYVRPLVLMGFKLLNQGEKDYLQDGITNFDATVARTTDFVLEGGVQVGWRF